MSSSPVTRAKITAARIIEGRVVVDLAMLFGEQRSRVELLLPGGITQLPAIGADVAVLEVGGNHDHLIALVADDPTQRETGLAVGDVALRAHGQSVVITAEGVEVRNAMKVTIVSAGEVVVDAPTIRLGSASAAKAVKLADGSNAAKVFAE